MPQLDGRIDPEGYESLGLSARGVGQAEALARRLRASRRVSTVYASPARRARETAAPIAEAFSLEVYTDERLREIGFGNGSLAEVPAALRARVVREHLAQFARVAMRDGTWTELEGTEAPQHVRERMRSVIAELVKRHAGECVVAVSHAGAINAYFAEVLGIARDFFFPTGNTSLSVVRMSPGGPVVVRLNDTAHLEATEADTSRSTSIDAP